MLLTIIITVFCFIVWFALYNAFTLRWAWETIPFKKEKLSKTWHQFGAFVRMVPIPIVIYYFYHDLLSMGLILAWYFVFCWPVFDITLNLGRGYDWWYKGSRKSGTGSLMDIFMSTTVHWILKVMLVLGAITITIIYIINVIR
jgi:hypothetical protein